MAEFEMQPNSQVKLYVTISSDAIVGSNVSLDGKFIKKSISYRFTVDLGNSNDLNNSKVRTFSHFLIESGDIDPIMESTTMKCVIRDGHNEQEYQGRKIPGDDDYFVALRSIKLKLA
ncbi:hypothetical protein [Winogradskyella sp. 3972H.M.0a.05]|uniref:hypothetical protein n=1 Tax=Winogradskyella sp. 3972H.M.0a.05 TaxID=2950277 RepID=UPI00339A33C4